MGKWFDVAKEEIISLVESSLLDESLWYFYGDYYENQTEEELVEIQDEIRSIIYALNSR